MRTVCLLSPNGMSEGCFIVKEGLEVSSSVKQQIKEVTHNAIYVWYEVTTPGYKYGQKEFNSSSIMETISIAKQATYSTYFDSLVLSHLMYALPVWGP